VTESIDCLPLAAVITSWPHLAGAVVPARVLHLLLDRAVHPAEDSAAGATITVMSCRSSGNVYR